MTVPAEIVGKAGLRRGSRLEWQTTDRPNVLEVHVLPDAAALAAGLRGRGNASRREGGSAVSRLLEEREREEPNGGPG